MQDLELEVLPEEFDLQLSYSDDDDSVCALNTEYNQPLLLNHRETLDENSRKIYEFSLEFSLRRQILSQILHDTETDLSSRTSFAESLIQNTERDLITIIDILEEIIKTKMDENNYAACNNIVLNMEENSDEEELCGEHFNSPVYKKISITDDFDDEDESEDENEGMTDNEDLGAASEEDEQQNADEDEDGGNTDIEYNDDDDDDNETAGVLGESMLFN